MEFDETAQRLKQIESSGENDIARFGQSLPALLRSVQKHKDTFHRPPIGPIGREVQAIAFLTLFRFFWKFSSQVFS